MHNNNPGPFLAQMVIFEFNVVYRNIISRCFLLTSHSLQAAFGTETPEKQHPSKPVIPKLTKLPNIPKPLPEDCWVILLKLIHQRAHL